MLYMPAVVVVGGEGDGNPLVREHGEALQW